MSTSQYISSLRTNMLSKGIDAVIIPNSDPHMSEYCSRNWKKRNFISGFTGSAGIVVILAKKAGLWTDSRYYLQAEEQLKGSGIDLYKTGETDTPTYTDWIIKQLKPGAVVSIENLVFSTKDSRYITNKFESHGLLVDTKGDILDNIWQTRPVIPEDKIFVHDIEYAGISSKKKIALIHEEMRCNNATHYIITALDEVAWVLNMRGSDVSYNPVFHAYLLISSDKTILFINKNKISTKVNNQLIADNITILDYNNIFDYVNNNNNISINSNILFDPNTTNALIYSSFPEVVGKTENTSIVRHLKSIKNKVEIEGFRKAMVKDGVAMTKFLYWFEKEVPSGNVTEISAAKKLEEFRSQNTNFIGKSFGSISCFGAHGAIVHYSASKVSDAKLSTNNFYLIDSGGQYLEGTTDITRTIHTGNPNEQQIIDFTLVLKGNIALDSICFPEGTRGIHLDILARKALWSQGLNYGHGTGHGVGCFLNVHEGPQSIRPNDDGIYFKEGMVTSNEPGLYRTGKYGIRTENLLLSTTDQKTEFGSFLKFETLTLCPIQLKTIKKELLTCEEIEWLNNYHQTVYDKISPFLDAEHKAWLKSNTKSL